MHYTKRGLALAYLNVLLIAAVATIAMVTITASAKVDKRVEFRDSWDLSCTVGDGKCGDFGSCEPISDSDVEGPHICICSDGYTNFDGICDYQRKPQFNVFLASFFGGGVGADWFLLYSRDGFVPNGAPSEGDNLTGGGSGNGGYIVAGIFKLLTAGGFSIWWLVDFIRVLTMSFPDANGMRMYENLTDNAL